MVAATVRLAGGGRFGVFGGESAGVQEAVAE